MQGARGLDTDFDRLSQLYKVDPEAFEQERSRIIQQEIAKYPPEIQERLRKYQWVLDMKRKRCKNPLQACFMFHDMLMEQVYGEGGLLDNLYKLLDVAKAMKSSQGDMPSLDQKNGGHIKTKVVQLEKLRRTRGVQVG